MSLYGHIGELRKRNMWAILAFFIFLIAGFFLAKPVIVYLQS
ncbi:twin-arginine translocase subunit TatC, partial [Pseudotabrizicola alkalilacus]